MASASNTQFLVTTTTQGFVGEMESRERGDGNCHATAQL